MQIHKLCIHLHLGETYESLKFLYRVPAQTIGAIVPEMCQVIVEVLRDQLSVSE